MFCVTVFNIGNIKNLCVCVCIFRTFWSREPDVIVSFSSSFIHQEYCCHLWSRHCKMKHYENWGVQENDYTEKNNKWHYWSWLLRLPRHIEPLFSPMLLWALHHLLNVENMPPALCKRPKHKVYNSLKATVLCFIHLLHNSGSQHVTILQHNYFSLPSSALLNIIPKQIEEKDPILFKWYLEKFLQGIPDKPAMPRYISVNNSSLLEWALTPQNLT